MLAALCACAPKNEFGIREKKNKNMVKFGWWGDTIAISTSFVDGFTLTGIDGSEFVCSTSTGDPYKEGAFFVDRLFERDVPITVTSGTTVYWTYYYHNDDGTYYPENETIWLEIINRKDSKNIGYAVIKVDKITKFHYEPTLVKAVTFPKVDGEYPTVTDEQVEQLMKSVETE